jgi:hypothetical protein
LSVFGRTRNQSLFSTLQQQNFTGPEQVTVMQQHADRYDWRQADRLDPSVLFTLGLGIALATVLASLL